MSGHSKWAGIKHKKAAADSRRANLFTKLANTITVATKRGGGDPSFNPALRTALDAARKANMPKDKVDRAIKRGTGELGGSAIEELLYEGFGPGNVALLVEVLTDNRNRSTPDIRTIFTKTGGRLADGGGVAYQFSQKGVIRTDVSEQQTNSFEELVIEGGADDYRLGDGHALVYTNPRQLHVLADQLIDAGFEVQSAVVEWVPNSPVEVDDLNLQNILSLIEALEAYDDVTNVFTNLAE